MSAISSSKNDAKAPQNNGAVRRAPIVAVMGHVDHGKTTLLDFLRKTRIADREAGGITQSVGAYEVERNGSLITFIDTPGHEAFTKMRQRGATIADMAILVVAADDGVKPQTKEAIDILKESAVPFVVAINKIDKNNADVERTKQSLMMNNVLLEKYGGDTPWVAISAKEGTNIDELLDTLLLMWDMQEVTCHPQMSARGFVLESRRDSKRGIIASLIINDGTLHSGDEITTPTASGKVKIMEDFKGVAVKTLGPASPTIVVGFNTLPVAGEEFRAGILEVAMVESQKQQEFRAQPGNIAVSEAGYEIVHVMLKSDVSGSLEALTQIISHLSFEDQKVKVQILSQEVGDITDGDVTLARTMGTIIVGFNVKVGKSAEQMARTHQITIMTSNIIYRIIEQIEEFVKNKDMKPEAGVLEVLAVFSNKNKKWLIGGKMLQGYLTLNEKFTLSRNDEPIANGRILNLQQNKADRKKVESGECGMMVETPAEIVVGDHIIVEG